MADDLRITRLTARMTFEGQSMDVSVDVDMEALEHYRLPESAGLQSIYANRLADKVRAVAIALLTRYILAQEEAGEGQPMTLDFSACDFSQIPGRTYPTIETQVPFTYTTDDGEE